MRRYRLAVAVGLVGPYLIGATIALWLAWPVDRFGLLIAATTLLALAICAEAVLLWEPEAEARDSGVLSAVLTSGALLAPMLDRLANGILLFDEPWWPACMAAGAGLVAAGGCARLWARVALGRHFTHAVQILPDHRLVSTGPYRYVRHPAYLGTLLVVCGASLLFGSAVGVAAACLLAPLGIARIDREERLLRQRFGTSFERYSERVPRLLPFT